MLPCFWFQVLFFLPYTSYQLGEPTQTQAGDGERMQSNPKKWGPKPILSGLLLGILGIGGGLFALSLARSQSRLIDLPSAEVLSGDAPSRVAKTLPPLAPDLASPPTLAPVSEKESNKSVSSPPAGASKNSQATNLQPQEDTVVMGHLTLPTRSRVAGEVAREPHGTPPSLRAEALALAPLMAEALLNASQASELFESLALCALDAQAQLVASLRGVCLANASRLAAKHPQVLAGRFAELKGQVSADVSRLARATGLFEN